VKKSKKKQSKSKDKWYGNIFVAGVFADVLEQEKKNEVFDRLIMKGKNDDKNSGK